MLYFAFPCSVPLIPFSVCLLDHWTSCSPGPPWLIFYNRVSAESKAKVDGVGNYDHYKLTIYILFPRHKSGLGAALLRF